MHHHCFNLPRIELAHITHTKHTHASPLVIRKPVAVGKNIDHSIGKVWAELSGLWSRCPLCEERRILYVEIHQCPICSLAANAAVGGACGKWLSDLCCRSDWRRNSDFLFTAHLCCIQALRPAINEMID